MKNVKLNDLKPLEQNQRYFWFKENKKSLYESLLNNGYNVKKGRIKITYDNYIIDGHHRHFLLNKMYGGDFNVDVIRLPFNRKIYVSVLFGVSILILPILFIYYIILRIYYGIR